MFPHETFHIHLYGPQAVQEERSAESSAESNDNGSISKCETAPIPSSFEAAEQRLLDHLPDVLLEPDGSFAWASPDHQIVGMIYDAADLIQYVEIRGHCDRIRLRKLVEVLSGTAEINSFSAMSLPERQWKTFQRFERLLPDGTSPA